jgi:hypothetical protein
LRDWSTVGLLGCLLIVGWLLGHLVHLRIGWWLTGWLVDWLNGCFAAWLVGCWAAWLLGHCWLVIWPFGLFSGLVDGLTGWLVDWLNGLLGCLFCLLLGCLVAWPMD